MLERTHGIPYGTIARQDESTPTISGRYLAHAKLSANERALLMADLYRDRLRLTSPTVKQCAGLGHVCVPYVAAAINIIDDGAARTSVLHGDCTVLGAARAATSETLAEHFARATPAERLEAARVISPAVVWDHMIAPLV